MTKPWVHETALVEPGVHLGRDTRVWDNVHLRAGAHVGRSCIIGEKSYLAYGVYVGDFVKINASVYLCAGVVVDDFCMLSAHVVFTNDRFPRAGNRTLTGLETSQPTEDTLATRVKRGATIGANATIGPGLVLGQFCMVGMGAVITRDVPPHALVVGNPAMQIAWVCACGPPVARLDAGPNAPRILCCERCGRSYRLTPAGLELAEGAVADDEAGHSMGAP